VDVVDSLEITPHVFADGYIGLETKILLGSKLTPEGVKQLPIVTKKEIENKENRIRQGESLIIGGIRKTEMRDVVRGVPFLKDIPLLGVLFSGRDFEERAVETIFILTPTISTGGRPNEEVVEEIKRKHEPPTAGALHEAVTDPFGLKAREREQQRNVEEIEQTRLEAEVQKAEARLAIREVEERADRAEAEARKAEAELNRVKTEAEAKVKTAEKAREEAEAKAEAAEKTEEEAKENQT
jgi:Flp pilus assembly secretin CpaC